MSSLSNIGTLTLPNQVLGSTSNNVIYQQLLSKIVDEIKSNISNFSVLKNDIGLLTYICNIVENSIQKNNSKSSSPINKQSLVIDIMVTLFSLNPPEITNVTNLIQFLLETNQVSKNKKAKGISYYCSKVIGILKKIL